MPKIISILFMLLLLSCYKAANHSPTTETASNIKQPKPDLFSVETKVLYGGQAYKIVNIDGQVWFAENLNYEAEGSLCYENNPDNCAKYGRLYDWETALKACPKGWHLPSKAEWDELYRLIDGTVSKNPHYSNTGEHLKLVSSRLKATGGWDSDGNGTDDYGFSALPGGYNNPDRKFFSGAGSIGFWWTATQIPDFISPDDAYFREIADRYNDNSVYKNFANISLLFSVRCVKD